MPFQAPYQQKYPPTQKAKNSPSVWGSIFNGGGQPEYLYGGRQKFGQPNTGMFGANPALAGRLWQSPLQQVPRVPGPTMPYASRGYPNTLGASRDSMGGRYSPPSAGGGYGGWDGFMGGPGPSAGFAAPVSMNRPGYGGQPAMPESPGRYPFGEQEVGPMLGRVPIGPGMHVPEGGAPGDAEALKAAYMRRRDAQFTNPVNQNQERMAQLTGVPLSESLAYARANMQPVARGTIPSVGSSNPSLASVNNLNGQLLTDPTNIQAQFSSQLGQPTNDELALKAWSESRGQGGFTREQALANANRGAYNPATGGYRTAVSVYDAIRDPNFNANGAQFGGATIAMDSRGRTFFTDKERGPDPGAAAREERRLAHMAALAARNAQGGGDRPAQPYLQGGQPQEQKPYIPNGTVSYNFSNYSPEQRAAMEATQQGRRDARIARMEKVTERAAALAEQRKASLASRRQGPSLMDQLAQRNPELAMRMAEGQQRERMFGQNLQAQQQLADQNAKARLAEVQAQAQGQLGVANAQGGFNTQIADKEASAKKYAADAEAKAAEARLTGEQRAAATGQFMAWASANPDATPQQRNEMLQAIMGQQGQQAQPGFAGNSPWRFFNNPGAGQPAQPGQPQQAPAAQGPFADDPQTARNKNEKVHWGELTQDEYDDLEKSRDNPRIVADKLMAKYKDKKKASEMLNKFYGRGLFGTNRRSVDNPSFWGGWSNYLQSPEFMPYDTQGQPSEFF